MAEKDDEDERLRAVALHNAQSILLARRRAEEALRKQSEWLRITLASIGDAVISTDAEGRVTFMNGVAEALTGWSQVEAAGRPLPEVFRIVNEHTRLPAENPALRALREGTVVGLANHTVLVARDGSERPIDDSAAPMRDADGASIGSVLVFRDIIERKGAEEARARLAAIVESSEDAIVSKSLDGTILSWNAGAERLFGYTPDEAVGRLITLIIPPERIDEERAILDRLRRGERIQHFETVRVSKDGRRIDISLSISPLRSAEGQIVGASKVARDITDRKRAEAALRESEGRHRFFAGLAASTQALTDPEEVMAVTARLLAEHLRVDRCAYAEVEDESVFVITGDHPIGVPSIVGRWPVAAFGSECVRLMLANEPYVVEDVDSDARVGPNDLPAYRATTIRAVICVPLHKGGKFNAAMAVHQTTPRRWTPAEVQLVTTVVARCWEALERTRVTRTLRESEARYRRAAAEAAQAAEANAKFRAFFEQGTNFAGVLALDGTVVEANRLCLDACGIARDEVMGKPFWECPWWNRSADLKDLVRSGFHQAGGGRVFRTETNYFVADGGERVTDLILAPVTDEAGRVLIVAATGTDITERKHLEDALRETDRKKDDFIALLAHELRNPLAPIRNGLQVIRIASDGSTAITKARSMMDRQLTHMVRLIDDLLDISRISRNKMELRRSPVLLADVVSSAVETAHPLIDAEGHELTVTLSQRPVWLDADLTRLAQVFGNLLTNSARYTERGGRIWITAERRGGEVVVSVKDTGIGVPPESLADIFDMFSQVDRDHERSAGGLGIGLALVKGLVEMHGGTERAESEGRGRGSTFIVTLPAMADGPTRAAGTSDGGPTATGPGRRILVVDDNRDGADSLAMMLRLLDHEVCTANDGVEAVEQAERFRPEIILMDVGMPRLNGLDATRRIRQQPWAAGTTIIALTGWGQDGDRERTREAGCDGHLVKPVNLPDLQKVLGERRSAIGG